MAKCKSCNAEILWAITPNGKQTPLDAKPVRVATLLDLDGILKIEEVHEGHISHLATCPNAKQHKRETS